MTPEQAVALYAAALAADDLDMIGRLWDLACHDDAISAALTAWSREENRRAQAADN